MVSTPSPFRNHTPQVSNTNWITQIFEDKKGTDLRIKLYTRLFVAAITFIPFSYLLVHLGTDKQNLFQRSSILNMKISSLRDKIKKSPTDLTFGTRNKLIELVSDRISPAFCSQSRKHI